MDQINQTWGRGSLRSGASGFEQPWAMRAEHRSPRYTTRWDELPMVRSTAQRLVAGALSLAGGLAIFK
jgi:DNA polymerase V